MGSHLSKLNKLQDIYRGVGLVKMSRLELPVEKDASYFRLFVINFTHSPDSEVRSKLRSNCKYYPLLTTPLLAIPSALAISHDCTYLSIYGFIIVIGSIGNHCCDSGVFRSVDIFASHIISPLLLFYFSGHHFHTAICTVLFLFSIYTYYKCNRPVVNLQTHSLLHLNYVIGGSLIVLASLDNESCH